jgi:phospholipase/carboxylesterase
MRGDFFFAAARDRVLAREASIGRPFYVEARQLLAGRLHLPRNYRSGKAYPLVVGLHGRGATCEDFARIWSVLDNPQFIFLSLESPYAYAPGVETHKPAFTWGLPTRDKALWALADPLVSDNLKRAVETVSKQHRIAGVYILGHSQGAAFAYLAALRYPELFKGVMAFAGVFPSEQISAEENAKARGKVRVFMAHGTRDQAVPLAEELKCKEILVRLGYAVTFFQFDGDHGISIDALKRAVEWMEKGT